MSVYFLQYNNTTVADFKNVHIIINTRLYVLMFVKIFIHIFKKTLAKIKKTNKSMNNFKDFLRTIL